MKYVVLRHTETGKEHIFVFSRDIDHDRFVEAQQAIRFGTDGRWRRHAYDFEAVSAGFVVDGYCNGYSETLRLGSRGPKDTILLRAALPSDAKSTAGALRSVIRHVQEQ